MEVREHSVARPQCTPARGPSECVTLSHGRVLSRHPFGIPDHGTRRAAMKTLRIVTLRVLARRGRKGSLNEGQVPNVCGVRVAPGTGYNRAA
jgi:hypothetical protein